MFDRKSVGKGLTAGAAVALLVSALPLAVLSKPSQPAPRIHNQQQRIQQGVKSGQLTQAEYRRTEARLQAIRQQRQAYLRTNDGRLTAAERSKLNRELNGNSNRIYFTKHNEAVRPGTKELGHTAIPGLTANPNSKEYVNQRLTRQMDRIRNGVVSGQITRGEYNGDIHRLRDIQAQENTWLKAQGGHLTAAQKDQLNQELNGELHRINTTKHNSVDQPGV